MEQIQVEGWQALAKRFKGYAMEVCLGDRQLSGQCVMCDTAFWELDEGEAHSFIPLDKILFVRVLKSVGTVGESDRGVPSVSEPSVAVTGSTAAVVVEKRDEPPQSERQTQRLKTLSEVAVSQPVVSLAPVAFGKDKSAYSRAMRALANKNWTVARDNFKKVFATADEHQMEALETCVAYLQADAELQLTDVQWLEQVCTTLTAVPEAIERAMGALVVRANHLKAQQEQARLSRKIAAAPSFLEARAGVLEVHSVQAAIAQLPRDGAEYTAAKTFDLQQNYPCAEAQYRSALARKQFSYHLSAVKDFALFLSRFNRDQEALELIQRELSMVSTHQDRQKLVNVRGNVEQHLKKVRANALTSVKLDEIEADKACLTRAKQLVKVADYAGALKALEPITVLELDKLAVRLTIARNVNDTALQEQLLRHMLYLNRSAKTLTQEAFFKEYQARIGQLIALYQVSHPWRAKQLALALCMSCPGNSEWDELRKVYDLTMTTEEQPKAMATTFPAMGTQLQLTLPSEVVEAKVRVWLRELLDLSFSGIYREGLRAHRIHLFLEKLPTAVYQENQFSLTVPASEKDLYPGDLQDTFLFAIAKAYERLKGTEKEVEKMAFAKGVLDLNSPVGYDRVLQAQMRPCFWGVQNMTEKGFSTLKKLGFTISNDGKHYKMIFRDHPVAKKTSMPKTSSDWRGMRKAYTDIKRVLFD